jgi:hypothetical protein
MPKKVRVVTPTDPQTKTITTFFIQLTTADGWSSLDYRVYSAGDDNINLALAASYAVDDEPDVIFACGLHAAKKCVRLTTEYPIVFVGGAAPRNPPSNLTGLTIEGNTIADYALQHLGTASITVLYDNSNDPSNDTYAYLRTRPNADKITPLQISDPGAFAESTVTTTGFMLIPNAMYYKHRRHIVKMVDRSTTLTAVYYPEPEYKNLSTKQAMATVYGYDILATFTDAADIVSGILGGQYSVSAGTLPPISPSTRLIGPV